jgi:hypothetical protein
MKNLILLLAFTSFAQLAFAKEIGNTSHIGKWRIAPEWAGWFAPECREMEMKFTEKGTLIRTTGKLVYESKVELTNEGFRVKLNEKLLSHNSENACAGVNAEKIVQHLNHSAYITVSGDRLFYYRNKNKESLIVFSRI